MEDKDFQDLIDEIDAMSIEEYNEYHKKAIKMKESCFYIQDPVQEYEVFSYTSVCTLSGYSNTEGVFTSTQSNTEIYDGESIWPKAA